jgi:inorganic phosphate transporter, PiT family
VVRNPKLYEEPKGSEPPPWWIRGILILTCTGVSFAHGSNDGQKGMGLIMLILIGTVPTAYALNRAMPGSQVAQFAKTSQAAAEVVEQKSAGHNLIGDPRPTVTAFVASRKMNEGTFPALAALMREISAEIAQYGSISRVPAAAVGNTRNDMYIASEAIRFLMKDKESELNAAQIATLQGYKKSLDDATKFIPLWVKVAVAIALGMGTMIGWRRIVVTVGEKIGKAHMTYAQGASAELVAMTTIAAADMYGNHARAFLGRRRRDDGEWVGIAVGDGAQPVDGLDSDFACRDPTLWRALHRFPPSVLMKGRWGWPCNGIAQANRG